MSNLNRNTEFMARLRSWIFTAAIISGPILAIAFFIFFKNVFPILMGNSLSPKHSTFAEGFVRPFVSVAPHLALIGSGVIFLAWVSLVMQILTRRLRLNTQNGAESIRNMSWVEFELLIAEAFRRLGYRAEHNGDPKGDGGVDVLMWKDDKLFVVQCKHWKKSKVGVRLVRELAGSRIDKKADKAILISTGLFTNEAKSFASRNDIRLIGAEELLALIQSAQKGLADQEESASAESQGPEATPMCPKCKSRMVQRIAKRGTMIGKPFWGCVKYPSCHGILNIVLKGTSEKHN